MLLLATYKLVPYDLKVRYKGDKDSWWNLLDHSIGNSYSNLTDFLLSFCSELELEVGEEENSIWQEDSLQKTLAIDRYGKNSFGSLFEGVIKSGSYGYGADFYNVEGGGYTENARLPEDSEILPFYFLVYIPPEEPTKAILILERFQGYGVKTVLKESLSETLGAIVENSIIHLRPKISSDLVEQLMDVDRFIALELKKDRTPRNIVQQVSPNLGENSSLGPMTVRIRAERGGTIWNRFYDWIEEGIDNADFPFANILDQNFDSFQVEVYKGGNRRKIPLIEEEFHMEYFLDPEDIIINNLGHPEKTSIALESKKYLNEILSERDFQTIDENSVLF